MTVSFIDANRADLGVEPIVRRSRGSEHLLRSQVPAGLGQLQKGRPPGPGDQVARLMKLAGIVGVRRGRAVVTTRRDHGADRAPDLVKRHFVADRPNALWVTDLIYVAT